MMLKKLLLVSLFGLLVACSSTITQDNYGKNVIVSKNGHKIVGKKIIPVDLIGNNLSLKKSILFVTARTGDDKDNKSTIHYEIEYTLPKDQSNGDENNADNFSMVVLNSEKMPDKLEVALNKRLLAQDKAEEKKNKKTKKGKHNKKKEVAVEPEVEKTPLVTLDLKQNGSRRCSKTQCVVRQTISFDIDTQLLQDAQKNGFVFLLKPETGDAFIETMIPASYLTSLFEPSK